MSQESKPQKRKVVESDSDDDNLALKDLKKKVVIKKEPTHANGTKDSTKNGVIKSQPPSSSASLNSSASIKKEESDDSDDDVPIAVLMKRKQEAALAAKKAASPAKKAKVDVKKNVSSDSKKSDTSNNSKPSSSARSSSSSSGSKKIVGKPMESSDVSDMFYSTLDKGKLCQRLLRRWWYAFSWPQDGVEDLCPRGYEALRGYPGVFVGTAANCLGQIVDKRDQDTCPNLRNFSRKSSAELKDLCIVAYEEQIRQLIDAEGPDTKLERTLRRELAEIKHIKPEKADRQSDKLLKQPF